MTSLTHRGTAKPPSSKLNQNFCTIATLGATGVAFVILTVALSH